jgi:hypothetical protein
MPSPMVSGNISVYQWCIENVCLQIAKVTVRTNGEATYYSLLIVRRITKWLPKCVMIRNNLGMNSVKHYFIIQKMTRNQFSYL